MYQPWRQKDAPIPDSYKFAVNAVQQEGANRTIQDHIEGGTFCIGSPETCINTIKKYEEVGIDQVFCFLQFGKLPQQKVMDSIRMIGKYVIPYFQ